MLAGMYLRHVNNQTKQDIFPTSVSTIRNLVRMLYKMQGIICLSYLLKFSIIFFYASVSIYFPEMLTVYTLECQDKMGKLPLKYQRENYL